MSGWAQAISSAIGLVGDQMAGHQQYQNNIGMMNAQAGHQMDLNNQMQDIQQQNWDYTNYENQVKHMENAGLNVGMMYGGSGGGGATMGGASGGSAGLAHVDKSQMGMILAQAGVQNSQINLNDSMADKAKAEADRIRGVDTQKTAQETQLSYANTVGAKLENALKSNNLDAYTQMASEEVNKIKLENQNAVNSNKITQVDADNKVKEKQLQLAELGLNNILTKSKTNLTNEQIDEVKQNVSNSIRNTDTNVRNSITGEKNASTAEWLSGVEAELKRKGLDLQEQQQILDVLKTIVGASIIRK